MAQDLVIRIDANGRVKLETEGMKGEECLRWAELVAALVGKEVARELTAEFHEPGPEVLVRPLVRERRGG